MKKKENQCHVGEHPGVRHLSKAFLDLSFLPR